MNARLVLGTGILALGAATLLVLANVPLSEPADAAAPVGTALAWDLLDCEFVYGTAVVPAARIASRIPAGFTPFAVTTATGNRLVSVGFEVDVCESGAGLDGRVEPMTYASTWVPVLATSQYNVQGVSMFLNWETLVPDDERRALLRATGTPAFDGEIRIDRGATPLAPFSVDYRFEDVAGFRFDIVPRGEDSAQQSGEFAQYTPGENGTLTFWQTKWATTTSFSGVGTITLDPASWQAEVFGATTIPAQFQYGTWDYTDGRIVLPS